MHVQELPLAKVIAGKKVGPIGYGLMGKLISEVLQLICSLDKGITSRQRLPFEEGIRLMKAALDHGANFWNGVSYSEPLQ